MLLRRIFYCYHLFVWILTCVCKHFSFEYSYLNLPEGQTIVRMILFLKFSQYSNNKSFHRVSVLNFYRILIEIPLYFHFKRILQHQPNVSWTKISNDSFKRKRQKEIATDGKTYSSNSFFLFPKSVEDHKCYCLHLYCVTIWGILKCCCYDDFCLLMIWFR